MPLLLTMSFLGSVGTLVYIVLQPLTKKYLSVRWRRCYLVCNILEYLIPFPCFRVLYKEALKIMCGGDLGYSPDESTLFTEYTKNVIQVAPGKIYVPDVGFYCLVIVIVMTGMVVFCVWMQKYRRIKKFLWNHMEPVTDEKYEEIIRSYCFVFKKNMQIYQCDAIDTPFTIGVFHPIIVLLCRGWSAAELKMVMEHETVHVCQWDNLIKIFVLVMVVLNFYNPLAWYVLYQWNAVAELSCDRKVIEGKTREEMKQYGLMVIGFAEGGGNNSNMPITGFSMQNKMMKERIDQMKNGFKGESVFRKLVGLSVMGIAIFASSLSVLAYSPKSIEFSNEICDEMYFSEEDVMWGDVYGDLPVNESGGWVFFSEETKVEEISDEFNKDIETHAICIHSYVSGKSTKHTKYSDNSCKVDYYNSKKCSKCGEVVLGEVVNTSTFISCLH